MTLYEKFKKLDIDASRLGLEQGNSRSDYLCTPKGAKIIGWEGVDGIHYCFIKGFGEMVFAVNPSNLPGDHVHPLASSFEDFLRLLLACGGTAAVEQMWMWNRGEFDAFLETYPPDPEQKAVLDSLRDKLALTPMDDPYGYVRGVQSAFDYSKIPHLKKYYDLIPDEPKPQEPPKRPEWKVTFRGGFDSRGGGGRAGKEIPIGKTFTWGGEVWHIPAVYVCGKGLVVDFCMEIEPSVLGAFLKKWRQREETGVPLTQEEEDRQIAENAMMVDFDPKVTANSRELSPGGGDGSGWTPIRIQQEYEQGEQTQQDWEMIWLMEHYGLDPELGWFFDRRSFFWATKSKPALQTLKLHMSRYPESVPGSRFTVAGVGDVVEFTHPATGETLTLQVVEYKVQKADMSGLGDGWEYPDHYTAMTYVIEPELPQGSFVVRDCGQGDTPRVNAREQAALAAIGGADGPVACSVGIIGGVDGPAACALTDASSIHTYSTCSALHFEPPERIEWQIVFREKTVEDIELDLVLPQNQS